MRSLLPLALVLAFARPCIAQPATDPIAAARDTLAEGNYQDAENALRDFLRKTPDAAEARLLLARSHYERGQFDTGDAELAKLLEKEPENAAALTLSGEMLLARGRHDDAERALAAALKKEPDHLRARLARCQLHLELGLYDQAAKELEFFFDYYNANDVARAEDLLTIARGVWLYGVRKGDKVSAQKVVSDLLPAATKADKKNADALAFWGSCYLEKYDYPEAANLFKDALALNPNLAYAHYGMAASLAEKHEKEPAERSLQRALQINPNLVEALDLQANFHVEKRDYEGAITVLEKARKVNPRSLPTLGLAGACHYLLGEKNEFAAVEKAALAVNPKPAEFYYQVGESLSGKLRWYEGQDFLKKAAEADPSYWQAQIGLGLNYLRMAQEKEGKEILERAFERDPFHVWTKNTLKVLDALDKEFVTISTPHYTYKFHQNEKDLIEPYARAFAEECWTTLCKRYGFEPEAPILVEVYPQHGDLSVRTFGLGGLGILGACFGRLVVMDSPKAQELMGPFNWASVLWHEMSHVFHLQLSKYRVPRWFTEGLATYEESLARPGWDREMEVDMFNAFHNGALKSISALDKGDTSGAGDLVAYYYYGMLMCRYIDKNHGFDKLVTILKLYSDGKTTPEVFQKALGMSVSQFDSAMQGYVRDFLKDVKLRKPFNKQEEALLEQRVKGGTSDGETLARYAQLLVTKEKFQDAQTYATQALEGEPDCASAYVALGDIYYQKRPPRYKKAIENYLKAIERGNGDFQTRMRLARAYEEDNQPDEAIKRFQEAKALFPRCAAKDQNPYSALVKLYEKKGDGAAMLKEMEALIAISNHDFPTRMRLAKEYRESNRVDDLVRVLTEAVFIQPVDVKLHAHLAEALREKKRPEEALREYGMTVTLLERVNKEGKADEIIADYTCDMAELALELGRKDEAKKLVEQALTTFPDLPRAQELRKKVER